MAQKNTGPVKLQEYELKVIDFMRVNRVWNNKDTDDRII